MLVEESAAEELGERGLRQLVGVQVSGLLDDAKALDGDGRRDDPSDTQTGESHFGEAVDVNDDVGAIELLERRNALFAGVEAGVNVVFDDGNLVAGSQFEDFAPSSQGH